jgi:hypothetical protein
LFVYNSDKAKKPGTFPEKIVIKTYALLNRDPSKTYNITAQVCSGMCGSHHPHTAIYDARMTIFIVTEKTMNFSS